LSVTGSVRAQGFALEVRDQSSATVTHQFVQEFLPRQSSDPFPMAPVTRELTRVSCGVGTFLWRLRFFTPLDPPGVTGADANWSAWANLTTLTADTLDSPRKPVIPPASQVWYYPESGAEFTVAPNAHQATVNFDWSPVSDADSYYLYLATGEGWIIINRELIQGSQLHGVALNPGRYFWAVCPVNSELGRDGVADAWMSPYPFFTVLPVPDANTDLPGTVTIDVDNPEYPSPYHVKRVADGIRIPLTWNGRVAQHVRLLVLIPGIVIEPTEDKDALTDRFTTDRLDRYLKPGDETYVKVQGISASGAVGPWSSFVKIKIPAK
jgi:hypothetical protein